MSEKKSSTLTIIIALIAAGGGALGWKQFFSETSNETEWQPIRESKQDKPMNVETCLLNTTTISRGVSQFVKEDFKVTLIATTTSKTPKNAAIELVGNVSPSGERTIPVNTPLLIKYNDNKYFVAVNNVKTPEVDIRIGLDVNKCL